jgi:phage I-like protein
MKLWKTVIGDPIRGLTLERLSWQIERYTAGYPGSFALSAESMETRDDVLKNVISKRKKAVARHGWEILTLEDSPKAETHRVALENFYNNLTCTNAIRNDERGGLPLLIFQMMDAMGKGYAVHEITWRPLLAPSATGSEDLSMTPHNAYLTAELRFIPLWFFENSTGKLRFLESSSSPNGIEMREREWLVTVGEALMIACSRAFLFKHFPLQAWLDYCLKYGTPGLRAVTSAARNSDEWNQMAAALEDFMTNLAVVTNNSENIDVIDLKGSGKEPFADLVERMDRVMIALWRGADLSTLSRNQGYGASLQGAESKILELDDAELISTTLNSTLDDWVIKHLFGENQSPLAYIRIMVTPEEATSQDLAIDQFLVSQGAKLSLAKTLQRYGRAPAGPGEKFLGAGQNRALSPSRESDGIFRDANPLDGKSAYSSKRFNQKRKKTMKIRYNANNMNQTYDKTMSLANSFTVTQPELIQISPYGKFPHAKGYQKIDAGSADTIVKSFNSFLAKLGRRFAGVPLYIGHPDVPEWQHIHSDKRAYGWLTELFAHADGLYGKVKWSKAGQEILENAHFKFLSPYWEASKIGQENGQSVYQPNRLISVGLTNEPNLPVLPLANNADESTGLDTLTVVGESTALFRTTVTSGPTNKTLTNENKDISKTSDATTAQPAELDTPDIGQDLPNTLSELESTVRGLEQRVTTLSHSYNTIDERIRSIVVDNAIANTKIPPAQRKFWLNELKLNFENACLELLNAKPLLKQERLRNDFNSPNDAPTNKDPRIHKVYALVHARMGEKRTSYADAWNQIREENPEFGELMNMQPDTQKNTHKSQ